jgi:hydrogenase maturation protease
MKGSESQEPRNKNQTFALGVRYPVILSSCHLVTLVIGYGNPLRGDDAIGPRAALAVAAWEIPGVRALAVHQLVPELAEALAAATTAIFVDAHILDSAEDAAEAAIAVEPIGPATSVSALGHTADPRALLALTAALYGRCPAAWAIAVPAPCFALGAALSPQAERGLSAALLQVRALLDAAHLKAKPFIDS